MISTRMCIELDSNFKVFWLIKNCTALVIHSTLLSCGLLFCLPLFYVKFRVSEIKSKFSCDSSDNTIFVSDDLSTYLFWAHSIFMLLSCLALRLYLLNSSEFLVVANFIRWIIGDNYFAMRYVQRSNTNWSASSEFLSNVSLTHWNVQHWQTCNNEMVHFW